MRNDVWYEWVFEEIENDEGDIIDPQFCKTLKECMSIEPDEKSIREEIAIVRFTGNEFDGVKSRDYAYIKDNKLPEIFPEYCHTIPKKFHKELANATN